MDDQTPTEESGQPGRGSVGRRPDEAFDRKVLDSLRSAIAVLDHDGLVLEANEVWRLLSRHRREAVPVLADVAVGSMYFDALCDARDAGADEAVVALRGIGTVLSDPDAKFSMEYRCDASEAERWFALHVSRLRGGDRYVVLEHVDITERKRAEIALQRHRDEIELLVDARTEQLETYRANYRRLVELSPGVLYIFSSHRGGIYYSPGVESVLGYSVDHLLQHPFLWNESIHPDDRELVTQAVQDALNGQRFEVEYRLRDARGEWLWFKDRSIAVRQESDEVIIEGLGFDITERKQAEGALRASHELLERTIVELKAAQEQLVQQEKLRAVGELACGIGHDLNNILTPVLGYADLMVNDETVPPTVRERIRCIRTGASDAARIVSRLRKLYRPAAGSDELRTLELEPLLLEVVELTRPIWHGVSRREGRDIELDLQIDSAPPVAGSDVEIREVLSNLLINAVDALPNGGRITLRLREERDAARIEVSDTGIGMSAATRARCFEPFFSTKGHRGTGLGLSVCHGIVARHGGKIRFDSAVGRGTTVFISLPAAEEGSSVAEENAAREALPSRRVLYIDDDPHVRSFMRYVLETLNQDADAAESGVQALDLLATEEYDLVITDLSMPEMDGEAVTREIKRDWPTLPVVLVTGWGAHDAAERFGEDGAPDSVLAKPFTTEQLRDVLARVLA